MMGSRDDEDLWVVAGACTVYVIPPIQLIVEIDSLEEFGRPVLVHAKATT